MNLTISAKTWFVVAAATILGANGAHAAPITTIVLPPATPPSSVATQNATGATDIETTSLGLIPVATVYDSVPIHGMIGGSADLTYYFSVIGPDISGSHYVTIGENFSKSGPVNPNVEAIVRVYYQINSVSDQSTSQIFYDQVCSLLNAGTCGTYFGEYPIGSYNTSVQIGSIYSASVSVNDYLADTINTDYDPLGANLATSASLELTLDPASVAAGDSLIFSAGVGPATSVPEPASLALLGVGLLGLTVVRSRLGVRNSARTIPAEGHMMVQDAHFGYACTANRSRISE